MHLSELKTKIADAMAVDSLVSEIARHRYLIAIIEKHSDHHGQVNLMAVRTELGEMLGLMYCSIEVIDRIVKSKTVI